MPITAGYSGTLNTTALGLNAARVGASTLKNPGGVSFPTTTRQANDHVAKFTADVPAGTTYARFSTFDADYPAGTDLDVFVYRAGTTTRLGSSTGGSAEEEVNLPRPAVAARYLGQLHFSDGADGSGSTIVRVDT